MLNGSDIRGSGSPIRKLNTVIPVTYVAWVLVAFDAMRGIFIFLEQNATGCNSLELVHNLGLLPFLYLFKVRSDYPVLIMPFNEH